MKRIFTLALGFSVIFLQPLSAGVERYGRSRDVTPGNYAPLLTGTPITIQSGNVFSGLSTAIPIGFVFTYDGISYDTLRLSTNGYILLGTQGSGTTAVNDLDGVSTTNLHKPVLAPLWDAWRIDLVDSLTYSSSGGVFTAHWKNVYKSGTYAAFKQNFMVKLYADGHFEFIYGSCQVLTPYSATLANSTSIGINDPIGGPNHFLSLQAIGTNNFSSTVEIDTLRITMPALDERYTFTPPTPLGISSITVPSASYSNLRAVFDTLRNYGISSAMDILVGGSTSESAVVNLDFIPGSLTYPVTLKLSVASATISGTIAGSPLLRFRGMRNFTLDGAPNGVGTSRGLTIENLSVTGAAAIQLTEGSQQNVIKNSILKTNTPNGSVTNFGVVWIADPNVTTSASTLGVFGTSSRNTIQNCEIAGSTGGRPTSGILILGSNVTGLRDSSNLIIGNTIHDFGGTGTNGVGVRLGGGAYGTLISSNQIYMTSPAGASVTGVNGIRLDASSDSVTFTTVEKNRIDSLGTTATAAVIAGIFQTGTRITGNVLVNNFVNLSPTNAGGAGSTLHGISQQGGPLNVYFNTVRLAGSGANDSSFAFVRTVAGALNLRNNIFYNGRSATTTRRHYTVGLNNTTALTSNYNDYFADGTNGTLGKNNATNAATIVAWRVQTAQDAQSLGEKPNFVSSTNLHIDSLITSGIASGGTPLSGYADDIDSYIRSVTTPDIGADEFNSIPFLISTIPDTTLSEDFGKVAVRKLTGVFDDLDNATLNYGASVISGSSRLSVLVSNDTLYVTSVGDSNGVADLRVTADDGAITIADTFRVSISAVNDAPVVFSSARDTLMNEDGGRVFITKLNSIFHDPDNDLLTYTDSVSNSKVTSSLSNDSLYITPVHDSNGVVTIYLKATDPSLERTATSFILTLNPVNDAPVVATAPRDTSFSEDIGKIFITQVNALFYDTDRDLLMITDSVSNSKIVALISNDSLYVIPAKDSNGIAVLYLKAVDPSLSSISTSLQITINAVNDAPVVTRGIANQIVSEDFAALIVASLDSIIQDIDAGDVLTYTVVLRQGKANGTVSGNLLQLSSITNIFGNDTVVVTAKDALQAEVSTSFVLTIHAANDGPLVFSAPRDTSVNEDGGKIFIVKLSSIFRDPDTDVLTYKDSVSNSKVISTISNDSLYIKPANDSNGTVTIYIKAADPQLAEVSASMQLTINPSNDAPKLTLAIRDTALSENFGRSFVTVLSGRFVDVDNPVLIYSVNNLSVGVTGQVVNDSLYLMSTLNFSGTVNIEVRAGDGALSIADTFAVTVVHTNRVPVIAAAIRDTIVQQDFGKILISKLTSVFSDGDNLTLNFSATSASSGVLPLISNDSLYIVSSSSFLGVVDIIVTAGDGLASVKDTFRVSVVDVTPPVLFAGALSSEILNVLRLTVGANESLQSVSVTANSQPITMQQSGSLFFGNYTIVSQGSVPFRITATDMVGNSSTIDRQYQISTLDKPVWFDRYRFISSTKAGYLIVNQEATRPLIPENFNWVSDGVIEYFATTNLNSLKVEMTYGLEWVAKLKLKYSDFDEAKIGLYQYDGEAWVEIPSQGDQGKVVAMIKSAGTSKQIAVLYNANHTVVPTDFVLKQNYPNPFNPTTTIRYAITEPTHVSLKIYNILGQEVRTLVEDVEPAGFKSIVWDGKTNEGLSTSSGVYIYRLQAGHYSMARKMVLVK